MTRALLDQYVPGWEGLDPMAFRWRLAALDAHLRPALRAALDAIAAAPPAPPAPAAIPESPPAKTRRAPRKAERSTPATPGEGE